MLKVELLRQLLVREELGAGSIYSRSGGAGGAGGFGFYNAPIAQPYAQPYSVGAAGAGSNGGNNSGNPGSAGGNTTIANIGTVNGGAGGGGAPRNANGNTGADGTQPGASLAYSVRSFISGGNFGVAGNGGPASVSPAAPPAAPSGTQGILIVFENTGT
jgi:hypothetical protein